MEIEELVKLAIVYHDIDQEKMMESILRKDKKRVIRRKILISVGITVMIAVQILALSFGFSKSDPSLPPESAASDTSAVDPSVEQTQIFLISDLLYEDDNVVLGSTADTTLIEADYVSDNLHNAFESFDNGTKYLIKANCGISTDCHFLYEGKTLEEYDKEAFYARKNYIRILTGKKQGSADAAKKDMETAYELHQKAYESIKNHILAETIYRFVDEGMEIISINKQSMTILLISSKDPVLRIADEEKENIIFFSLGSLEDIEMNRKYTFFEK